MNELAQSQAEQPQMDEAEALRLKQAFVTEYGELVKKHGIDFAQYPVWVPDGNGGFKTILQNAPVFMKKEGDAPFVAK
jgi:hypothetical protein